MGLCGFGFVGLFQLIGLLVNAQGKDNGLFAGGGGIPLGLLFAGDIFRGEKNVGHALDNAHFGHIIDIYSKVDKGFCRF